MNELQSQLKRAGGAKSLDADRVNNQYRKGVDVGLDILMRQGDE